MAEPALDADGFWPLGALVAAFALALPLLLVGVGLLGTGASLVSWRRSVRAAGTVKSA